MLAARRSLHNLAVPLVPPVGRWSPRTDRILGVVARPTGSQYIQYEDFLQTGETAANTNLYDILGRASDANLTSPKYITLPAGIFSFTGFPLEVGGTDVGLRFGEKAGGFKGLWGMYGVGRTTIIRNLPFSSSQHTKDMGSATPAAGLINVQMILAQGNDARSETFVFKNFQLRGEDADHYYEGILIYNSPGAIIENLYLRGANPGFKNAPPGETMAIKSNNASGLQILDCEVDGRHWQTNTRIGAAVIGMNNTTGITIKRFFGHHALASMVTFYQCSDVYTEDLVTWTNGTENGNGKNGAGINHERNYGTFEHVRPTTIVWGVYSTGTLTPELAAMIPDDALSDSVYGTAPTQNSGIHITMNVYESDNRYMTSFIVRDPLFDTFDNVNGSPQDVLAIRIQDEYPVGRDPLSLNGQTYHDPEVYNTAGNQMEFRRRGGWFLDFSATPTSGQYTLTAMGNTTAPIAYNATNAQIAAALNAVVPAETGSAGAGDRSLRPIAVFNATNSPVGRRREIRFGKAGTHTFSIASSTLAGATLTASQDRISTTANGGLDKTQVFMTY